MTSNSTKCPYCRRRYQQAAAYEKHLQTMDVNIVLSLKVLATADQGSPQPTAFRLHENVDPDNSDCESDPELEIADQGAYNEIEMIGKTIQIQRILPNHQLTGAHPAKRLFQVLEDNSAMLLTIQSSIWLQQITPGAHSRRKRTLI